MACGCGGGASRVPLTAADYNAQQEAAGAGEGAYRFRLVRPGYDDQPFVTYAAARNAAGVLGGVVRTMEATG